MKCPQCQRRLKIEATSCLCGWRGSSAPAQEVSVNHADIERERARHMRWLEACSPTAEQSIAKIKEILKRPRPTVREHWQRVLNTPSAPYIAREYAIEYLQRKASKVVDRIPGEDDETFRHPAELV